MIWLLMALLATAVLWLARKNEETNRRLESLQNASDAERKDLLRRLDEVRYEAFGNTRKLDERVGNLERGTVPDYEQAKAAAKAVDDFNSGLANILNYDPFEARRKAKDAERGLEE